MVQVFGYVRVSTAGQAKDGTGLEEQRAQITSYCEEQGFKLVAIYEDAGISGAKVDAEELIIDRPGIQDLLADLKESGVKYVVVLTTSRLWRSDFVKVLIQREFKKYGVDIRAIDRPTYSIHNYDHDPSAFLVNGMMELLDQYERLEITLKLRRGRHRKASKGGYSGGRPAIGYTVQRGGKVLTLDTKKVETVQRTFELRRQHTVWTLQQVADQLNREGHTTAQGKRFRPMQVKRILDRMDFYAGTYRYAGIQAGGQHQAIIPCQAAG